MSYFIFKEGLLFLATPFPLSLILMVSGMFLVLSRRRLRLAGTLVAVAVGLLFFFSVPFVSMGFIGGLERRYQELPADDLTKWNSVKYIVVLGAGSSPDPAIPLTSRQYRPQLARVIEGMRIYHKRPGSQLIVSGGALRRTPDAEIMGQFLREMGIREADILKEADSLNTFQQALNIKKMIGEEDFFLVTSAVHMPRAVALFQEAGLHPIPHAADRRYRRIKSLWAGLRPRSESLWDSETAIYEWYGWIKSRLLGQL